MELLILIVPLFISFFSKKNDENYIMDAKVYS